MNNLRKHQGSAGKKSNTNREVDEYHIPCLLLWLKLFLPNCKFLKVALLLPLLALCLFKLTFGWNCWWQERPSSIWTSKWLLLRDGYPSSTSLGWVSPWETLLLDVLSQSTLLHPWCRVSVLPADDPGGPPSTLFVNAMALKFITRTRGVWEVIWWIASMKVKSSMQDNLHPDFKSYYTERNPYRDKTLWMLWKMLSWILHPIES